MCGRFFIGDPDDEWDEILSLLNRRAPIPGLKLSGEVFPTDLVPALAPGKSGRPSFYPMRWGYSLGESGKRIINARVETAAEKPMFLDGMRRRRCAVPASRYFEWTRKSAVKRKFSVRPEAGGLFYLAGLYRFESGLPVFTVLTRAPSESVAFLHDRMPVLLCPAYARRWVEPEADPWTLLPHALLQMECAPVSETPGKERPFLEF